MFVIMVDLTHVYSRTNKINTIVHIILHNSSCVIFYKHVTCTCMVARYIIKYIIIQTNKHTICIQTIVVNSRAGTIHPTHDLTRFTYRS